MMKSKLQPRKNKKFSIALVSGGLDSTVAAAAARRDRPDHPLALLHLSYGQQARARELKSFRKIAGFLRAELQLVSELRHLQEIGGSSLTEPGGKIPLRPPGKGTPSTYVPFRNANLLAAAVSWAEVIGADRIYLGVSQPDAPHYPDTRPEFIRSFSRTADLGTKAGTRIGIFTPLIKLRKPEIILLGQKIGAPLHLTWSCYRGGSHPCGKCASCTLRRRGFREAGIKDPARGRNLARKRPAVKIHG